ncbi:MAG: Crp/Fnr family transcriptional regulator [Candidatus Levybacteria bacterium]|nr:Crp/Fnr family transcriptional regulator [Candidatus Levybacteria bacterium]MBI3070475.1 Crp/Fnr family transcriptional regulator [Candidatus Levybacteria bacterium]MBI3092769.1 Crp/Fnr family transcriptional regulator [Candidatus Levybacteria bacterium]
MDADKQKLKTRLEKIWQQPDFTSFFQKYAKRPPLNIKKGNIIFYQGDQPDRIYFVKEGFVKLYRMSEEGKDTVIYLYGPGSILGVRALTSQDERLRHNAEAITDSEIITMSRKEYLDLVLEHPEYLVDLLHVFIERLNYTERKLEGFILTDATARVANFLADCARRFRIQKNKKVIIPLPLTHQRIAEFVGSFRETATVALNRLQKEKILKVERGKITILDLKKLNEQALIER